MGRSIGTRTSPTLVAKGRGTSLPSKRQLEIALSKTLILDSPDVSLEQYPVSPEVGAELLYMAGFEHSDISDRRVVDLGAGTGRLAIGASLLGAKEVHGIDVDPRSLDLARKNTEMIGVNVEWTEADIQNIDETFDTVVMNPPYGTKEKHADTGFMEVAFRTAPVVYSIHKSSTRAYVQRFIRTHRRQLDAVRSMDLRLPHLFPFHRKKWRPVNVDIFRVISGSTTIS